MARAEQVDRAGLLFDLDGTLVDSVYQHVLAWREALDGEGIEFAVWRIHRRIGMSGGLFADVLLRETGHALTAARRPPARGTTPRRTSAGSRQVRPLPGARELLRCARGMPWAIATSGRIETAGPALEPLGVSRRRAGRHPRSGAARQARSRSVPRGRRAPGRADEARWSSATASGTCSRRGAHAPSAIGLLSGGYGQEELERAGAYRVYEDPADLLAHLDEVGVRPLE